MMAFVPSEVADRATFDAIFRLLDGASRDVIGPTEARVLVIPIRFEGGGVIGGLWAVSAFRWLHLEMLFVPESMRGQGVGSALMAAAATEARSRGCLGVYVDTLSFQATSFYEKLGFTVFGMLDDCPPGHQRLFLQKRLVPKEQS
jgi:GNAT superfamily N-acetyltransferase